MAKILLSITIFLYFLKNSYQYCCYMPYYRNIYYISNRQPIAKETSQFNYLYITDKHGKISEIRQAPTHQALQENACNKCGQNANCEIIGGIATCACPHGYEGDPHSYCKKIECLDDSQCRNDLSCFKEKCINPCNGACGVNALCHVQLHRAICTCPPGHTGNSGVHCRKLDPEELCLSNPCGANAKCIARDQSISCQCISGYVASGSGCDQKRECSHDRECSSHLICQDYKCQNPCIYDTCAYSQECVVKNHRVLCEARNYQTNGYSGYNAKISYGNGCDGACGINANCAMRDIEPICSCPENCIGDPKTYCKPYVKEDLCSPFPCGENAGCEPGHDSAGNARPVCTCLPGYFGNGVTGCKKPQCISNSECANNEACLNYKCQDACINQCGLNAVCKARNHSAGCSCKSGFYGDAFKCCFPIRK